MAAALCAASGPRASTQFTALAPMRRAARIDHLYKYGASRPGAPRSVRAAGRRTAARGALSSRDAGPAPLARQWQRGFNQSSCWPAPSRPALRHSRYHALKRVRPTVAQAGLSNTGRSQNVAGPLSASGALLARTVEGKRLLLIDDA